MNAGKFGIVVVVIALAGALLGAWVMSMDVNEDEVTKYRSLAEMTGEFQSEPVPEYTRFNPSTNYTGYYTDDSIIGGKKYFDGVEYESSNPNNFRLNLKPLVATTADLDLTDATTHPTYYAVYWDSSRTASPNAVRGATIAEFISDQGWTGMDQINIVSDLEDYHAGGFFTFFSKSSMKELRLTSTGTGKVALLKNPDLTGTLTYRSPAAAGSTEKDFDASQISNPILACRFTVSNNQVELFYDREMTQPAGIFTPNDAVIFWTLNGDFGTDGEYTIYDLPEPAYMDPAKGVELS